MASIMLASALMVNICRIHAHHQSQTAPRIAAKHPDTSDCSAGFRKGGRLARIRRFAPRLSLSGLSVWAADYVRNQRDAPILLTEDLHPYMEEACQRFISRRPVDMT